MHCWLSALMMLLWRSRDGEEKGLCRSKGKSGATALSNRDVRSSSEPWMRLSSCRFLPLSLLPSALSPSPSPECEGKRTEFGDGTESGDDVS